MLAQFPGKNQTLKSEERMKIPDYHDKHPQLREDL